MHPCHYCKTPFELDVGTIALGYFARGRCPSCGSVNVIVPGGAPIAVAAAATDAGAVGAVEIEADIPIESGSGLTELPEATAGVDAPTGQVGLPAEDLDFVDEGSDEGQAQDQ